MHKVMERIGQVGIVPVVKIEDSASAVPLGKALVAGGIPVAEVTFRTDAALASMAAMRDGVPGLLVGAGTVTTAAQAEAAAKAGASFVVSPAWIDEVVDWCLDHGMPVLPGVSGPDGVARGLSRGLEILKFFPSEASGGLPLLDALSGPFPSLKVVPTGGIDAANVGAYARKPYVHAIGGSWMVKADAIAGRDWPSVEKACRDAVMALHGFTFGHLGIHNEDETSASTAAGLLSSLFGFAPKDGASSIFASESIEVTKRAFPGSKGHMGIRCNNVERAVAHFAGLGVATRPGTEKLDKGRLKAVYLDLEVAGFAVHLMS